MTLSPPPLAGGPSRLRRFRDPPKLFWDPRLPKYGAWGPPPARPFAPLPCCCTAAPLRWSLQHQVVCGVGLSASVRRTTPRQGCFRWSSRGGRHGGLVNYGAPGLTCGVRSRRALVSRPWACDTGRLASTPFSGPSGFGAASALRTGSDSLLALLTWCLATSVASPLRTGVIGRLGLCHTSFLTWAALRGPPPRAGRKSAGGSSTLPLGGPRPRARRFTFGTRQAPSFGLRRQFRPSRGPLFARV